MVPRIGIFVLLLCLSGGLRAELPEEILEWRDLLEARTGLIERRYETELETVRELYVASIRALADQVASTGDLDRVLLLRETADRFSLELPSPVGPPLSEDETFLRLQATWDRLLGERRKQRATQLLQEYQQYMQRLEPLQRRLTQEGEIDAAVALQQERRRVESLPELPQLAADAAWAAAEDTPPADGPAPAAVMNALQANIVLYFPFDLSDRLRRVSDRSRERHVGAAVGTELEAQGRVGMAMRFDGQGSHITVRNAPSLQVTGDLTLSFWTFPTSFEGRRNPFDKAYGGEFTITQEPNGHLNFYHGTSGGNEVPYQGFNTGTALPLGAWTHVVLVRDGRERKLFWYFNGTLVQEGRSSYEAAAPSSHPLRIGHGYAGSFAGLLDEILILNTALNARQVRLLYRSLGGR